MYRYDRIKRLEKEEFLDCASESLLKGGCFYIIEGNPNFIYKNKFLGILTKEENLLLTQNSDVKSEGKINPPQDSDELSRIQSPQESHPKPTLLSENLDDSFKSSSPQKRLTFRSIDGSERLSSVPK
jgi:hypothetical protein